MKKKAFEEEGWWSVNDSFDRTYIHHAHPVNEYTKNEKQKNVLGRKPNHKKKKYHQKILKNAQIYHVKSSNLH